MQQTGTSQTIVVHLTFGIVTSCVRLIIVVQSRITAINQRRRTLLQHSAHFRPLNHTPLCDPVSAALVTLPNLSTSISTALRRLSVTTVKGSSRQCHFTLACVLIQTHSNNKKKLSPYIEMVVPRVAPPRLAERHG